MSSSNPEYTLQFQKKFNLGNCSSITASKLSFDIDASSIGTFISNQSCCCHWQLSVKDILSLFNKPPTKPFAFQITSSLCCQSEVNPYGKPIDTPLERFVVDGKVNLTSFKRAWYDCSVHFPRRFPQSEGFEATFLIEVLGDNYVIDKMMFIVYNIIIVTRLLLWHFLYLIKFFN